MKKAKFKKILLMILLVIFIVPILSETTNNQAINPGPFFSINILCPTYLGYQWVNPIIDHLPKIGIAVDVYNHTTWAKISSRTWGFPGPYPIPSYSEGGFDVLLINWKFDLDVDLAGFFGTPSWPPNGFNHFQYSRPEMDWALGNYSQSYVMADRIQYAHDIQALLYEDVPQTAVIYTQDVFAHNSNLNASSWSPLLWETSSEDMANWEIPGQTEFHYATLPVFDEFHPYFYESHSDAQWLNQIYGGMVERTPEAPYFNAFGPYACTSFSSVNGINYSVQLDPNLVFADGTKCNATDVKFSYELFINPNLRQSDYDLYCHIMDNNTIEIIGEYEIQVNFLQQNVFQNSNLAISILPYHIWKDILPEDHKNQAVTWAANDVLDSNLMGIGPYYLLDYDETSSIIHLKANPYWTNWGNHTTQKFTDIYFKNGYNILTILPALASGEVDMVDSIYKVKPHEIPETANNTLVTVPEYSEIGFNCLHPYLGTGELCPINSPDSGRYIRKAINHIIPREQIITEMYYGYGSPGITAFAEGAIGFDETLKPFEYNRSLALKYMKLAGYDVPDEYFSQVINMGIGFGTIMGILSLVGGSIYTIYKIKRNKDDFIKK